MALAPNSLAARDVAYTVHPYTNLAAHRAEGPLIVTRGEGVYVWDEDGNRYIEGLAGLWCTGLGFSEPRLVDAAARQMATLPFCHGFAHRQSPPVIELAERLVGLAPEPLAKVFFANTGSEAVDTAMRIVWYYNNALGRSEKKKIIARRGAYHGSTVGSGSLTGVGFVHDDFDLPIDRIVHTEPACHYRHAAPGESEEDYATRLAAALERLILDEGPETVAAFIAEPVTGGGGLTVPPVTYFDKVQEVLARHDVLFVADEVICGFGRTGNMWGCDTYGIRPDLLTCAKMLSSAYFPISAVLMSGPVYDVLEAQSRKHPVFGIGYTYGGHPVGAAVALETLKIYEERDIVGHVRRVAPRFQARLAGLGEHPLVGDARGVGLMGGIELVADKAAKTRFPPETAIAPRVARKGLAHGVMLRPIPGDMIGLAPPLIVTEAEIDALFDGVVGALDDAAAALGRAA